MRYDQSETIAELAIEALEVRIKADACIAANAIIRSYFGSDNQVANMPGFYTTLVEALQKAREQGHEDCSEDVLHLA